MASDKKSMERERKRLTAIIKQWNESRLDLFAISLPNEKLECNGVMRFYHKDTSNNGKYATKCIRVSNNSSTKDVIDMLSTKFRPDMRMLTKPKYVINEVHVDGEMRQLNDKEKPLLVQLSWVKDDREGRFLLHNVNDKAPVRLIEQFIGPDNEDSSFKLTRNLTKKEKKLKKKQEKEKASKKNSTDDGQDSKQQEIYTVKHLYSQVPESTFTRTVSNPEAVMKKRREQKLQKRGANILKVYGDRLNPEIPYKSLLLLPTDNVTTVIRDALDKYNLGKEQIQDYNLIQVVLPPNSKADDMFDGGWGMETVLHDPQCPLEIEQKWLPHEGTLVFQLRHIGTKGKASKDASPPSSHVSASDTERNLESKRAHDSGLAGQDSDGRSSKNSRALPIFIELFASSSETREHIIHPDVTEIGSDRRKGSYKYFIELKEVKSSHCLVTSMDGVVSVTPQDRCDVYVNGKPIIETTMISHGAIVRVGRGKDLVYCEPKGKVSMPEIRKKLQEFAQSRVAQGRLAAEHRSPRSRQQVSQKFAEMKQKSASLPKDLNEQHYQNLPLSKGPGSTVSSTHSRQGQGRSHQPPPQKVAVLPATIQLRGGSEEEFLVEITSVIGMNLHFKLSPAYAIYMSLRDIVEVTPKSSLDLVLIKYLRSTTDSLDHAVQINVRVTPELAFWMANASELLNFVRHDIDVSPCTSEAQDTLAKSVQQAFRHLVQCMQHELFQLMPAFLSESDDDLPGGNESNLRNKSADEPTMYDVLHMLSSAMSLLRRCRVNAALTIQLFSQLFHFVNMWIFNEVITKPENGLCCRSWGIKLRARLARVEAWAEKQGLELAADCHLARVTQAMHLLQAPKQSAEDIANISGTCFKLNSLQLRALLSQYIPSERDGERPIPNELIDKVVQVARSTADELTRSDGRDVCLEEDPDLQLPFLLPEDGYSCDVVQSVPSGLTEFARPLVTEGICGYHVNTESTGSWTVHFMGDEETMEPEDRPVTSPSIPPLVIEQPAIATVSFNKRGGGLGLSIVAARGPGQTTMGIYIRAVVKGGAADKDGRLQAGDQLVNVDGHSLVGLSQEKAAEIMTKSGQIVTLTVAKKAALFHGLSALLEPSPETEQAAVPHRRPVSHQNHQPRPKSDGFALRQGYQPAQSPLYPKQEKVSHPRSNQPRPLAQQHNNRKDRPINKSTTQLNEERDHKPHAYTSRGMQPPRSAISMGNLQRAPDNESSKTKALSDWQRTWEEKKALSTYQKNRAKSTSSNVLSPPAQSDGQYTYSDQQNRREQVKSLFKHGHISPRQHEQKSPTPKAMDMTSKSSSSAQKSSIDNPNYDQLPPPPTPPPMSPPVSKSPESFTSQKISPRDGSSVPSKGYSRQQAATSSPISQTMSRPTAAEKKSKESTKPWQKNDLKSKSSTLPRHFKSTQGWDGDAQQRSIQEQLNALRDEEIDELSSRIDSLSTLEKSRLNNLLKEREFQRRVEEESRRPYSDEDGSDEGYEVPDRPDRDRLIQMQDDHAEQFDANRDQEEELRREEERERKKQLERERKEEEERERKLRERLERERILEEKRQREEEQRKQYEEEMRRQEEIQRREEEERAYQEELRRHETEKMRWEDERRRKEESERLRQEEENRRQEERLRREQELQERQRRQWLAEERERRQREEREKAALKEREERERERQRLASEREAREKEAHDAQKSCEEDEREQAERELLEKQLSFGKPSTFRKFNKPSTYGAASVFSRHASTSGSAAYPPPPPTASKPVLRNGGNRAPRPVSDGYFLGKTDHLADDDKNEISIAPQNSTSTYNVSTVTDASATPPRNPVSYVTAHNTPGVIGAQERYRDPRDRREAQIKREQSLKRRQQEPSFLTFKDRQRLFSAGQNTPVNKPRVSKKLLEIENSLKRQNT